MARILLHYLLPFLAPTLCWMLWAWWTAKRARARGESAPDLGARLGGGPWLWRILARLDSAEKPADMGLPGYRLHPLKGGFSGFWSVTVSGAWRIIFRFKDGGAYDVDFVNYH